MTTPTAEELVDEIMARAHLLIEVQATSEQLAEIDWEQFDVGSTFSIGAAFLVLREHDLIKSPTP